MVKTKNIGIDVTIPSTSCEDKKCPFHGEIKVKKRTFIGKVVSSKAQKSATVEWQRRRKIPKYERYEKRRTKLQVHNPPCVDAKEGDIVKIIETKPLSKTKNYVIIQIMGKEEIVKQEETAREKEKEKSKKRSEKKVKEENETTQI